MGRREDVLDGEFVKASRLPKSLCALYSRSGSIRGAGTPR
jgi:hypothetical protein